MKYFLHTLILIVFIIVQPTLLGYIEILGVKPNLFLVYIIIISCRYSKKEGAIVGFFFGLLLDLLTGSALGLNAVLMLILSFGVSDFCEKYIRKNSLITAMIIVFIATLLYEFVYYTIAFLGDLNLGDAILKVMIPESLYSLFASVPLYYIVPKQKTDNL